jgi:hypothetical protein
LLLTSAQAWARAMKADCNGDLIYAARKWSVPIIVASA